MTSTGEIGEGGLINSFPLHSSPLNSSPSAYVPSSALLLICLCIRYNQREGRTVLEVLQDFPSSSPPLEWLLEASPLLKPRQFSISSSARRVGRGCMEGVEARKGKGEYRWGEDQV